MALDKKALQDYLDGKGIAPSDLGKASSVAPSAASPAVPIAAGPTSPVADPSATIATAPSKKIEKKKTKLLFRAAGSTVEKAADPGKPDYKNQDLNCIDPANGVVGTLDGLSSTENGASQFVSTLLKEGLGKIPEQLSENKMRVAVESLVQDINKKLIAENTAKSSNSQTTLVFSKAFKNEKGENKLIVVNIGDSRLSLIHEGEIRFQTLDQKSYDPNIFEGDHTEKANMYWENWAKVVEKVKTTEKISDESAAILILNIAQAIANNIDTLKDPSTLDAAEMAVVVKELTGIGLGKDDLGNKESGFYPIIQMCSERNSSVAQTMGTTGVVPNIDILDIEPGDLVLTYSDGVTGNFTDKELLEIARANKPTEVPAIIKQRMEDRISGKSSTVYARTKKDDVTLAVLSIERELINKITFTNKDLLEVLNFRNDFKFNFTTTGNIAQSLGVTHDLASEILNRVLKVGVADLPPIINGENNIDANALDDFERYIKTKNMLDEVFVLPPPYKTVLETKELMDFIIQKIVISPSNNSLTTKDIRLQFNLSPEDAQTIIDDLKWAGALVDDKLADIGKLKELRNSMTVADLAYNMLKKPAPSATASTPDAGAPPTAPAVVPEAVIEKSVANGMGESLKNLTQKIWANKTGRITSIVTLVLFAAFTGAKILESKKEVHSENSEQGITAPINKDPSKSTKTGEVSGKSQGATSLESLNPNFENTRWWKELDQETKINIKWLLGTNDPQTWALKFFEKVEVVGESEKKELNHDEQIFLYNKLITNPKLLVESYSKNEGLVESCIVKMKNTNCYPRENVANIIVEIYKIFRVTDPQNVQEDLSFLLDPENPKTITQTFIWTQERLKKIIAANTK